MSEGQRGERIPLGLGDDYAGPLPLVPAGDDPAPPFAIGAAVWPGLAKLLEEDGELAQVIGKLMAFPDGQHPDEAGNLRHRLTAEIADVIAACDYAAMVNGLDQEAIRRRRDAKLRRFLSWHIEERERFAEVVDSDVAARARGEA